MIPRQIKGLLLTGILLLALVFLSVILISRRGGESGQEGESGLRVGRVSSHAAIMLSGAPVHAVSPPLIRVGIGVGLKQVVISSPSGVLVSSPDGGKASGRRNQVIIGITASSLFVQGVPFGTEVELSASGGGLLTFEKKQYRGKMVVAIQRNHAPQASEARTLLVINLLPLEEYLLGVVGAEMPSAWPPEALKAQAVVARTYAYRKMSDGKAGQFDLVDTVADQMYGGVSAEDARVTRAVRETDGEVLLYQGEVIKAYYHADCGGRTEDGEKVFPGLYPYCRSVACPFGEESPYHRWTQTFTVKQIQENLLKGGISIEGIVSLSLMVGQGTGRVEEVWIRHAEGEEMVPGYLFRKLMGRREIRSTKFQARVVKEAVAQIEDRVAGRDLVREVQKEESWTKKVFLTAGLPVVLMRKGGELAQFTPASFYRLTALSAYGKLPFHSRMAALQVEKQVTISQETLKLPGKVSVKQIKVPLALEFSGSGWGHGVGLCQWGARGMSQKGYGYREILGYYYRGVQLGRL